MRTATPKENGVHRNSRSVFHCGCFCYIIYRRRKDRLGVAPTCSTKKAYRSRVGFTVLSVFFSELRHGGKVENTELLRCVFFEHFKMFALPAFYLLWRQRRTDSAAERPCRYRGRARSDLKCRYRARLFFHRTPSGIYRESVHNRLRFCPSRTLFRHLFFHLLYP